MAQHRSNHDISDKYLEVAKGILAVREQAFRFFLSSEIEVNTLIETLAMDAPTPTFVSPEDNTSEHDDQKSRVAPDEIEDHRAKRKADGDSGMQEEVDGLLEEMADVRSAFKNALAVPAGWTGEMARLMAYRTSIESLREALVKQQVYVRTLGLRQSLA